MSLVEILQYNNLTSLAFNVNEIQHIHQSFLKFYSKGLSSWQRSLLLIKRKETCWDLMENNEWTWIELLGQLKIWTQHFILILCTLPLPSTTNTPAHAKKRCSLAVKRLCEVKFCVIKHYYETIKQNQTSWIANNTPRASVNSPRGLWTFGNFILKPGREYSIMAQ